MKDKKFVGLIGIIATASSVVALPVSGAGFQISEQTVAGMGQAFAGAGIARDDASNVFYNPAGMLANPNRQFQLGATLISADAKFNNRGSTQRLAGVAVPSSGPNSNGGDDSVVPNFYYTSSGDTFKWGLGVSAPYGLSTDYDNGWVGRYHALFSELKTININPAVAVKVSENVSIGAGVSILKADAKISQSVFTGPGRPDGKATLAGDDTEEAFNLGIMVTPTTSTRMGLGYRSSTRNRIEARVHFTGVPGVPASLPAESTITLPESVFASLSHVFRGKTEVSGSLRWTRWSELPELRISTAGLPDSVSDYQWEDVVMWSLGVNHQLNDTWMLRAGYAFDESPVPSAANRSPRVPDSDRDWFTLGVSAKISKTMRLDFSYARVNGDKSDINNTVNLVASAPGAFTDTLRGDYSSSVNLFGIQLYGEF
ncbi:MAG: fatty acid transporter [marine bacterium B5-7]|nr:MAG: fatty acid transporter [marine bacterium B5-7]